MFWAYRLETYLKICCRSRTIPSTGICVLSSNVWQLSSTCCMQFSTRRFSATTSSQRPSCTIGRMRSCTRYTQNRTDIETQDITTNSFASLPCLTLPTNKHPPHGSVSIKAGRELVTVCPMSFKYNMMLRRVDLMWAAWILTGYNHVRASALPG